MNLLEKIPVVGRLIHKKRAEPEVNADEEVFQNEDLLTKWLNGKKETVMVS